MHWVRNIFGEDANNGTETESRESLETRSSLDTKTDSAYRRVCEDNYHMTALSREGYYKFDPRYLVYEVVWNIQLRRKQVEIIVNDFRENIANVAK